MIQAQRIVRTSRLVICIFTAGVLVTILGCGPHYPQLRREGQMAMLRGEFGPARYLLLNAEDKSHRRVETLHDLGVCSVMVSRQKFAERNQAAAFRELDNAIAYYSRALDELPGHQASLEGKNIALELKGQYEAALKQAQWAAEFVGPSARQFIYLADELEERGDLDGALLRYRQAVAMEPKNPRPHVALAEFALRNGNEGLALEHFEIAGRLDPRDMRVKEQLAMLHSPRPQSRVASQSTSLGNP